MAAAFFLLEHVHLTLELGVGVDGARLHQHHAALDVLLLDAAEQQADVVTSHALIEQLAEHFHTGDGGFAGVLDADDLDFFANFDDSALDAASGHGAATGDGEDVLNGHQEGLIHLALGLGDGFINCVHEIEDLVDPLISATLGLVAALDVFESLERRTGHHGDVITGEVVVREQLTHLQFDELQELLVIHHVLLVEEDHQSGHAHLLGQQDVLAGLGHGAVSGGDHEDGAVHLGGTSDHVLHVVRVTGAIHVGVVAALGFVLNVGGVDGDAPFLLFRCAVDFVVGLGLGLTHGGEHVGDRSGQGRLAVVNVADCADVDVRFRPLKLLAGHC